MIQTTAAAREARANWSNNLAALRVVQPDIAELLEPIEPDIAEWVFARDGSLTAMTTDGKWWGGCSVPLLASQCILDTLETANIGSALLDPSCAALLRAARQRMGNWPVLLVVQPDLLIARTILSCHDFSADIRRHRLWIVCGTEWPGQLKQLLSDHSGLATPARFIRTKWSSDETILPMITTAQDVFSEVLNHRATELARAQANPRFSTDRKNLLIIGGTEFRLWDNAASTLHQQLASVATSEKLKLRRFDTDDALSGSPLALLHAAQTSGCVISANLFRADCNQLITTEVPWICWITLPAVPAFESAGPDDALILADPNWLPLARKAGWPVDRVHVSGWPVRARTPVGSTAQAHLALICNTQRIEIPASVKNYSSHRLLWELIEEELHHNPLAVDKVDDYLTDRAAQLHIAADALERRQFIESLILPAYQQGLARLLIAQKIPLRISGNGWEAVDEFANHGCQPLTSPAELDTAVNAATALIYCWPQRSAHPIEATGKPLVHRSGHDRQQLIRNAQAALRHLSPAPNPTNRLSETVTKILASLAA